MYGICKSLLLGRLSLLRKSFFFIGFFAVPLILPLRVGRGFGLKWK